MRPGSSRRSTAPSTTSSTGARSALVTAPVAKKLLYDAGFAFPGHTEYLAHLASAKDGQDHHPGDDAGRTGAEDRAGHHPHPAQPGALGAFDGADRHDRADRRRQPSRPVRHCAAPACRGRSQSACRRRRRDRQRGYRHRRAGGRQASRRGHRCVRAACRRYDVPRAGSRDLRCGDLHVSRSGADTGQGAGFRRGRERHARPAVHPHVARPRNGLRHCRHGCCAARQPDRCAEACRAADALSGLVAA